MSNNQNPEIAQIDPGNIAVSRSCAIDDAVEILASAKEKVITGTRIPKRSLVDFSEVPDDIWQRQAREQFLALKPALLTPEDPVTGTQPDVEQEPFSTDKQEFPTADELLRQAKADKDAAYDAMSQEETTV